MTIPAEKHSSPWKIVGMGDVVDANGCVVIDNKTLSLGLDVLQKIVRAVNTDSEMIAAVKDLINSVDPYSTALEAKWNAGNLKPRFARVEAALAAVKLR